MVVLEVVPLPKTLRESLARPGPVAVPIWNVYLPHPPSVAISPLPLIILRLKPHIKAILLKLSAQVACSQPEPSEVKPMPSMKAVGDWLLQNASNDFVNTSMLLLIEPTRQFGSAAATRATIATLYTRSFKQCILRVD